MKKIVSIFIVALMCVGFFILPSSAAAKNHKLDIQFATVTPVIDGKVATNEYGKAIHSIDNSDQFNKEFDPNKRVKATFYATWTKEALYMAWVVEAEKHTPMTARDVNEDGAIDDKDFAHMWPHSCVQFILTPGAPDATKTTYATNYLEVGLMVAKDGKTSHKAAWAKPAGANLTVDDWDFAGSRDEAKKTTTYEVRVPWTKSGIPIMGTGAQFGLSYAVADQENPDGVGKDQTGPFDDRGMVEWQDAILGTKNPDNAGVVTLAGGDVPTTSVDIPKYIELPALPTGMYGVTIDKINEAVVTGNVVLVTDLAKAASFNLKYTQNLILEPVAGKKDTYKVAQLLSAKGDGTDPEFKNLATGSVVICFHSDSETDPGHARIEAAKKLKVDDEVVIVGADLAKGIKTHTGMRFQTTEPITEPDSVDSSSSSSSVDTTTSTDTTTSSEPSTSSSQSTTTSPSSSENNNEGENDWIVWVIVGVVVVAAGGGAAYYFISKKKKAS